MGAVLHTLNIRLAPEQLAYIANHASDQIILVDASVAPLLASALPAMESVHTVIATGGDLAPLQGCGKTVLRYEEILAQQPETFDWPEIDERSAAPCATPAGLLEIPKVLSTATVRPYMH